MATTDANIKATRKLCERSTSQIHADFKNTHSISLMDGFELWVRNPLPFPPSLPAEGRSQLQAALIWEKFVNKNVEKIDFEKLVAKFCGNC